MFRLLPLFLAIPSLFVAQSLSSHPIREATVTAPPLGVVVQLGSSITGQIFNSTHRPLERVRIELLDENESLIRSLFTDGSGLYRFTGLSDGNYLVRVQPGGTDYVEPQTQRVAINNFSHQSSTGGLARGVQTIRVDFLLLTKEEAESNYRTGVVFAQDVPEPARKAYAESLILLKDEKTAQQGIEGLQNAVKIFPNYFFAQDRLGREYYKRARYEEAMAAFIAASSANPKSDDTFYWLGLSQAKLKKNSEATQSLQQALKLNSKSANANLALGTLLYADGKLDEAENRFKQAYKLGGKRIPIVHLHLAQLYDKTKRYKDELSELELYLKEQPDDPNSEKLKKAIENLRKKSD